VIATTFSQPILAQQKKGNIRLYGSGWLLIEEIDYGSVLSTDITNPSAVLFTTTLRTLWDVMRKRGVADPCFGRRVRSLVEQLGLIDVVHEGWTRINRGGEPQAQFAVMTLQAAAKPIIAAGLLTHEQCETTQSLPCCCIKFG